MSEKTDNESEKGYLKLDETTPNEYGEILAEYKSMLKSKTFSLKSTGGITGLKGWLKNGSQQEEKTEYGGD
ncbi:MAG: hypothetical protein U9P49_13780 [Thermodesulfobacteriota bacterium]|nr:hypothetical protein [Thermodesulfobacteriota bacterium]